MSITRQLKILTLVLLCSLFHRCKAPQPGSKIKPGESETSQIPNYPLSTEKDLDILLKEIGNARIVLLGDASHGTSEYYQWRAEISKRLITEKGFDFIALEGDWADSYRVNNFIKGEREDSEAVITLLRNYNRWPTWMWGNYEMASLIGWLNHYNQDKPAAGKVGFFGLDLFSISESIAQLIPYSGDTTLLSAAKATRQCFQRFSSDELQYATALRGMADCREQVNHLWQIVSKETDSNSLNENDFVIRQNAIVALDGERYLRAVLDSRIESWNIRDNHMVETLKRLLHLHGSDSKAIIWAHNTHVADGHFTNLERNGKVNITGLVRKEFGRENVFVIGIGSYSGSIVAADKWGFPIKKFEVQGASPSSWEKMLHDINSINKLILSKDIRSNKNFDRRINQRVIGAVYYPTGIYLSSVIPQCYDAYLFIDHTNALHPIGSR